MGWNTFQPRSTKWALDEDAVSGTSATIKGRRLPSVETGDHVIFFARGYHAGTRFIARATVGDVTSADPSTEEPGHVSFELTDWADFTEPRRLIDFAYTLQSVYNYSRPESHFRRRWRSLVDEDYAALVDGSIYWSRTALGLLLDALPEAVFREFQAHWLRERGQPPRTPEEYSEAFELLEQWVRSSYLAAAPLAEYIQSFALSVAAHQGLAEFRLHDLTLSIDGPAPNTTAKKEPLGTVVQRLTRLAEANRRSDNFPELLSMLRERVGESSSVETTMFGGFYYGERAWPRQAR